MGVGSTKKRVEGIRNLMGAKSMVSTIIGLRILMLIGLCRVLVGSHRQKLSGRDNLFEKDNAGYEASTYIAEC